MTRAKATGRAAKLHIAVAPAVRLLAWLAAVTGQQGLALTRGQAMTTEGNRKFRTTGEGCQPPAQTAGALPPMTPETARRAAAILAPHLAAMRAVTAGTRYASRSDDDGCDGELSADLAGAPEISPATKIFIAGMLELIPAPEDGLRAAPFTDRTARERRRSVRD